MPESPANVADPVAFRRLQESLERRAAVFMELATGDAVAGDRAVADAMRSQSAARGGTDRALAVRFWRALLAAPDVGLGPTPALTGPIGALRGLSPGLKAVVLLKFLSQLGNVELAALLGRSPASCRQAIARAEALIGADAWQALSAALETRAQSVTPARLVNIASRRSLPLAAPGWQAPVTVMSRPRRRALAAVVVLTVLGLVATQWWPRWEVDDTGAPKIRTRALAESAPKSRYAPDVGVATHPDRDLLMIPDADAAIARDTAFYAWYQAERLGTSSYEPPPPTFEAPESASSTTDTGGQDAP